MYLYFFMIFLIFLIFVKYPDVMFVCWFFFHYFFSLLFFLAMLSFIASTVWKTLFGKTAELEKSSEKENICK